MFLTQELARKRHKSKSHCHSHNCRSGGSPSSRHLNGSRARLDRADLVTVETEAEAGEIKEMASTFDTLLWGSELYNGTLEYLHSIDSVSRHR